MTTGRIPYDEVRLSCRPSYEVIVWDEAGRKTRGRVLLISSEEVVVMTEPRYFRPFRSPQEHPFRANDVTRVEIVDSTWKGTLIGAARAPALVYGIYRWEDSAVPDSNNMKGLATFVGGSLSTMAAILIGRAIDLSINESIYAQPSRVTHITVAPLIGRDRGGLMVLVSF